MCCLKLTICIIFKEKISSMGRPIVCNFPRNHGETLLPAILIFKTIFIFQNWFLLFCSYTFMFIILMGWALTIHKSQRFALTRSTIDIGNTEIQDLTFKEMSSTTTLEGMWIAPSFSFKHYAKIKNTPYVTFRKKKEACIHSLSLSPLKLHPSIIALPITKWKHQCWFLIYLESNFITT